MMSDIITPAMVSSIINGTQNVTAYSYEVAVKGTVADGAAGMVSMLFGAAVAAITAYYCWNWCKNTDPVKREISKESGYLWSFVLIVAMFAISTMVFDWMFHGYLMCIFAPEYVVISKVLAGTMNILS